MRLGWERPGSPTSRRVLTNRMREYFTYGSVGGAGGNHGSYPAQNPAIASRLHGGCPWRGVADPGRSLRQRAYGDTQAYLPLRSPAPVFRAAVRARLDLHRTRAPLLLLGRRTSVCYLLVPSIQSSLGQLARWQAS